MPATLLFILFGWMTSFFVVTNDFQAREQKVFETTYNYTQLAAKKGTFTRGMYQELKTSLSNLGEYDLHAHGEYHRPDGTKTIRSGNALLDYPLRDNGYDLLVIHAISKKPHPLTYFYKTAVFGPTGFMQDIRIRSQAASYIQ